MKKQNDSQCGFLLLLLAFSSAAAAAAAVVRRRSPCLANSCQFECRKKKRFGILRNARRQLAIIVAAVNERF